MPESHFVILVPMNNQERLQSLHALFCQLTERQLHFALHERVWHEFDRAGFTENDLRIVIGWMKASNRKHEWQYGFKLGNVIGDLARFDEILAEALAVNRNKPKAATPREQVVKEFQKTAGEAFVRETARPLADVLKGMAQ